jgi:hypothetical protein
MGNPEEESAVCGEETPGKNVEVWFIRLYTRNLNKT